MLLLAIVLPNPTARRPEESGFLWLSLILVGLASFGSPAAGEPDYCLRAFVPDRGAEEPGFSGVPTTK